MCPILGPLVLLFWISCDVFSGFQSQGGFCLIHLLCRGKCNVHYPRSTSGAMPANLLMAGITAGHFPTCFSRGETWLRFKLAITWTEDEHATIVPTTRLYVFSKVIRFCQCWQFYQILNVTTKTTMTEIYRESKCALNIFAKISLFIDKRQNRNTIFRRVQSKLVAFE